MPELAVCRRQHKLVGALCVVLFAVAATAAAGTFSAEINRALASLPKSTKVSALVVDIADGRTWYERSPNTPRKPASVLKLLTTAAALDKFGGDFALETQFLLLEDGTFCIVGGGDPGLADPRLLERRGLEFDAWAAQIAAKVREATGGAPLTHFAVDDAIFDNQYRHADWPAAQRASWYQAPVGGLILNDNCVDVHVSVKDGRVGAKLTPPLPPAFYRIEAKAGRKNKPIVHRKPGSDVILIRGTVAKSGTLAPVTVGDPTVFVGHAFKTALADHGVTCTGDVVRRVPTAAERAAAKVIHTERTPLSQLVWRCNAFSQNLFAEALCKAIAAYEPDGARRTEPGSWTAGTREIAAILNRLGVDMRGANLRDGSGLSHDNRATARQIVETLRALARHPQADSFRNSLAQPDQAGTLRRDYETRALRGRLWAKTGSLHNVRSLAGYVERNDGATLAFALLIEGAHKRDVRPAFAQALAAGGR